MSFRKSNMVLKTVIFRCLYFLCGLFFPLFFYIWSLRSVSQCHCYVAFIRPSQLLLISLIWCLPGPLSLVCIVQTGNTRTVHLFFILVVSRLPEWLMSAGRLREQCLPKCAFGDINDIMNSARKLLANVQGETARESGLLISWIVVVRRTTP